MTTCGCPELTEITYESLPLTVANRWDKKACLRWDAVPCQVIDGLEAQEIKETGNDSFSTHRRIALITSGHRVIR